MNGKKQSSDKDQYILWYLIYKKDCYGKAMGKDSLLIYETELIGSLYEKNTDFYFASSIKTNSELIVDLIVKVK